MISDARNEEILFHFVDLLNECIGEELTVTHTLTSEYITLDNCAPMPVDTAVLQISSIVPSRQQLVGMLYTCTAELTSTLNAVFPALLYSLPAQSLGPVAPQHCS